jgi:hypothetical protein
MNVNFELFELNGHKFKILFPSETNQYFVVAPLTDCQYKWIDKINMQCVVNNINKDEIINKIKVNLKKEKMYEGKVQEQTSKQENLFTIKSKLQKLAETSISPLISEKNNLSLFDKSTVTNIIINEFLKCSEYLFKEKQINLKLESGNIYVWKFDISNLKNIKNIEIELSFHSEYYPNYPPVVKVIKPKLKNSLGYRISNSKMIQLDYWTPTRETKFIISRLMDILDKYGEVDIDNKNEPEIMTKNIVDIENYLMKFASFSDSIIEDDEIDGDFKFPKIMNTKQAQHTNHNSGNSKEHWKKGTGYSHGGSSNWDIKEYEKSQKDKEEKLCSIIQNIIAVLQKTIQADKTEYNIVIKKIEKSLLISHLKQQFKNSTALDMHKNENTFKLYFTLLECLVTDKSMYLFNGKSENNETLFEIMKEKKEEFEKVLVFDKDNEIIVYYVNIFNALIVPFFENYSKEFFEKIAKIANFKKKEWQWLGLNPGPDY